MAEDARSLLVDVEHHALPGHHHAHRGTPEAGLIVEGWHRRLCGPTQAWNGAGPNSIQPWQNTLGTGLLSGRCGHVGAGLRAVADDVVAGCSLRKRVRIEHVVQTHALVGAVGVGDAAAVVRSTSLHVGVVAGRGGRTGKARLRLG